METITVSALYHRNPRAGEDHPRSAGTGQPFFGDNGFGFDDILDAINPLQHIPVVNTIYRHLTGDEISIGSRLAGGAVFGGAIGFAAAMGNAVLEDVTGHDVGEHVMALFSRGEDQPTPQMAEGEPRGQTADPVPAQAPAPRQSSETPEPAQAAFLAALPSREAALASREAMIASREPTRAASGDIPTLSPAAMQALLSSVNTTGANDDGGDEEEQGWVETNLAQDPASFAAWQAATQNWASARQ